jgi:hypothetical protein
LKIAWLPGKNISINHKINEIRIRITIGVKSIGHIVVGIYFFTFLYIGSIIEVKNCGLIFNQNIWSHDNIISAKIIYLIKVKNMKIGIIKFICLYYLNK